MSLEVCVFQILTYEYFFKINFLESFGGMLTLNDEKLNNPHGYIFFYYITSVYLVKVDCTVQYYSRQVMSTDNTFC